MSLPDKTSGPAADAIVPGRSSQISHGDRPQIGPSDLEKVLSRHEDADAGVTIQVTTDPDVIGWDGPDDPENALNWPARKKWANVLMLSLITILTWVSRCPLRD